MFLKNAITMQNIFNELNDAKLELEKRMYEREDVKNFNKIAFDLARALKQTTAYALEYGAKAVNVRISDVELAKSGDFYYTINYQCKNDEADDESTLQVHSDEIFVPANVASSRDPIVAAKVHCIMDKLGYVHSAIHSSAAWIEEKLKEEEELIRHLSLFLSESDIYSEQRNIALKKVVNHVLAEKLHKPDQVIQLSVVEMMKIAELGNTVDFAQMIADLLQKNVFKRKITLYDSERNIVGQYSSYDDVPVEFFDKAMGTSVPVLATQLRTLYEYIG